MNPTVDRLDAEPSSTEHPSPQRNVDRLELVETAETERRSCTWIGSS